MKIEMLLVQKEVNDCLLVSVANYISLIQEICPAEIYDNLLELIKQPEVLSTEQYSAWLDGHGMPLELIQTLAAHYGISMVSKLDRRLPVEPCVLVLPSSADSHMKYICHVVLWTGEQIHDPIQFPVLKSTYEEVIDLLPRVVIYSQKGQPQPAPASPSPTSPSHASPRRPAERC